MNPFSTPSNSPATDWLIFLVMLIAIGLGISILVVWMVVFRSKPQKKRKRRHRHHRQHNPTLAQGVGLPPMRDPDEPPPGP
jgi:heme/copper-type cytochrome/quinol oxidase subunit 2